MLMAWFDCVAARWGSCVMGGALAVTHGELVMGVTLPHRLVRGGVLNVILKRLSMRVKWFLHTALFTCLLELLCSLAVSTQRIVVHFPVCYGERLFCN